MMVLQGLLGKTSSQITPRRSSQPTSSRPTSSHSHSSEHKTSPESTLSRERLPNLYIREESQLEPVESEAPDLRELNHSLVALAAIFPDVQVEVFREMLSTFAEDSRLALVTEALLKNRMHWTRGRYQIVGKDVHGTDVVGQSGKRIKPSQVLQEDRFRSKEYKTAVRTLACQEFKGLSRSTINAVLAEVNHSYSLARPTLLALSSKSWRFSISSLFLRRKPTSAEAEHHTLVAWHSTGRGSIVPTLKSTGSAELDKELFAALIIPIQTRVRNEREEKDHTYALELNNAEAEECEALHDCECCYTSAPFEQLTACDDGAHFICFQCVRHALSEAVFGQGWQRNVDVSTGTIRCLAALSGDCQGRVSHELVRRALDEDKTGKDILRKFNERLAEDNLLKTNLPLIRCPFCSYAEVDELYLPEKQRSWRLRLQGPSALYTFAILLLCTGMTPLMLPLFIILSFVCLLFSTHQTFGNTCINTFHASLLRLRRKKLGLKFTCQNDECARASCISCSKAWHDIHICHESSLLALRTAVELAMSTAIKRTCPRCNTSFVKSSGCNKLTCVCGYQMCYVCRKDIGQGEGYRHFCEHFRPNGGRGCTECDKCDLYRCEDDEVVVKRARELAEREWVEREGGKLGESGIKKVLEEKLVGGTATPWWTGRMPWRWRTPRWETILDALVDAMIE